MGDYVGYTVDVEAFLEYFVNRGKVITFLVEAIDIYLLGTLMLVFGMGMYKLSISNLDIANSHSDQKDLQRSNLFGLFTLVDKGPNERMIGKLCEYAAKNPVRIPKISETIEQRCYKELRVENFNGAKIVLCIYRKSDYL